MAGYSLKPLIQKLGLKEGMRVLLVNTPEDYMDLLGELPKNVYMDGKDNLDFIHFFTRSQETLREEFFHLKRKLAPAGMLWISWPKSSCSFANTNLTEHVVREIGLQNGLVDVKIVAIDDDWSGLKFVYRQKDRSLTK